MHSRQGHHAAQADPQGLSLLGLQVLQLYRVRLAVLQEGNYFTGLVALLYVSKGFIYR